MHYKVLLYIMTSVWVLRTPNADWNSHFQFFLCKKLKKRLYLQTSKIYHSHSFIHSFIIFFIIKQKLLKITISTSIWGAQHPNTGGNMQQSVAKKPNLKNSLFILEVVFIHICFCNIFKNHTWNYIVFLDFSFKIV